MNEEGGGGDDGQGVVVGTAEGAGPSGTLLDKLKDKPKAADLEDDPELDALLNEAILDFGKVPKPSKPKTTPSSSSGCVGGAAGPLNAEMNQVWTEEFIREATAQFEKKMRECLHVQQQMQAPSPSPKTTTTDNLNAVVEAATKAAGLKDVMVEPSALLSQVNEAMKNFPSFPNNSNDEGAFNEAEFNKLMAGMGVGGTDDEDGGDLEEFLPFMTNFMQKLLSKDLLYPVLSDIVDRYPEWLADNRPKLSNDDFEKYNRQYGYMKMICEEYAGESPDDDENVKRKRFDKISALMVQVQSCGTPPKDLVGDDVPFPNMDPMLAMQQGLGGLAGGGDQQCVIC